MATSRVLFKSTLLSPAASASAAERTEDAVDIHFANEELSLEIRREKKRLRQVWNRLLLCLVLFGFVASYGMIVLIGLGVLNFQDNSFAVPSVVAAGIVETYGLAKLAIKYFFSEDGDDKKDERGR